MKSYRLWIKRSRFRLYCVLVTLNFFKYQFLCVIIIWTSFISLLFWLLLSWPSFLYCPYILSRRSEDGSSLQEVIAKIDQLKQAAEGLQDITSTINQLSELAKTKATAVMSNACLGRMKDAFTCLVCKGMCKICSSGYLYSQLVQLIFFHVESNCKFQHQSFLCLKPYSSTVGAHVCHMLRVSGWMPNMCGAVAVKCR